MPSACPRPVAVASPASHFGTAARATCRSAMPCCWSHSATPDDLWPMLTACSRDLPTPAGTDRDGCRWDYQGPKVGGLISGRLCTAWEQRSNDSYPEVRHLSGQLLQCLVHRARRLVTAGSGAPADCAAVESDNPPVEAGPVGVDSGWRSGRSGPSRTCASRRPCSRTAPSPWRDRISPVPTVRFTEARSGRGRSPLGRRGATSQRSTMVNHGASRTIKPAAGQP
jgi:hypothetical protein